MVWLAIGCDVSSCAVLRRVTPLRAVVVIQHAGLQPVRLVNGSHAPDGKSRFLFVDLVEVQQRVRRAAAAAERETVDTPFGSVDRQLLPWLTAAGGAGLAALALRIMR